MTLSPRSLRRASALTLAAMTLVACSDATAPLDVSPEQLEVIGQAMAGEIESGDTQLTAQEDGDKGATPGVVSIGLDGRGRRPAYVRFERASSQIQEPALLVGVDQFISHHIAAAM